MTIPSSDAGDPTDLWPVGKPCITALPHHTRPCAPQPADGVRCRCTRPKRSVVWSDRFKSTEGERFGQICPNLLSAHRSPVTAPPRPLSKSRSRCQHGPSQQLANRGPRDGGPVTSTETGPDHAERIIESLQDAENSALEAVRKLLDTVNGVFPDFTAEGGPRQKIIDSAFKMTEQLVGTSTQLAEKIVKVGQNVLSESEKDG